MYQSPHGRYLCVRSDSDKLARLRWVMSADSPPSPLSVPLGVGVRGGGPAAQHVCQCSWYNQQAQRHKAVRLPVRSIQYHSDLTARPSPSTLPSPPRYPLRIALQGWHCSLPAETIHNIARCSRMGNKGKRGERLQL